MSYYNIKSHKKPAFHPLFRRYIFRKTAGEQVKLTPPPSTPEVLLGLIAAPTSKVICVYFMLDSIGNSLETVNIAIMVPNSVIGL